MGAAIDGTTRLRNYAAKKRTSMLSALLALVDYLTQSRGRLSGQSSSESRAGPRIGIGIVGCGFVADFYLRTLALHPELELIGVTDRDPRRASRIATRHGVESWPQLSGLLADDRVKVVVNLTNPASHFAVSKASLEAGKHVYSEKPLALSLPEAEELVTLSETRNLILSAAPCSVLSESARALADALDRNEIGPVRVVYAELDDGPVHQMQPEDWSSHDGTPWPWRDEFSTGCIIEHAGYHLSWLVSLFGPAESVTAFSSCLIPDKHPDLAPEACGPDFSVACIRFRSGVVARLTCSVVAPHNHSLVIIGDRGVLSLDECWHFRAPVRLRLFSPLSFQAETYPWLVRNTVTRWLFGLNEKKHVLSPRAGWLERLSRHQMDYVLGLAELAAAVREGRPSRLSARFVLHVTELVLAINQAAESHSSIPIRSGLTSADLPIARLSNVPPAT